MKLLATISFTQDFGSRKSVSVEACGLAAYLERRKKWPPLARPLAAGRGICQMLSWLSVRTTHGVAVLSFIRKGPWPDMRFAHLAESLNRRVMIRRADEAVVRRDIHQRTDRGNPFFAYGDDICRHMLRRSRPRPWPLVFGRARPFRLRNITCQPLELLCAAGASAATVQ